MENSFSIGTTNRYALFLDDESDPLETLKIKEQEKELKKKTKVEQDPTKGKVESTLKAKPAVVQKKTIKDLQHKGQENKQREENKPIQRTNDNKSERFNNKFNSENREERNNRRNREDRPFNGSSFENNREREDRPRKEGGSGSGGEFDGRRGGRQAGVKTMGRGGPKRTLDERRGKREFDRQSGSNKTGVKPVDKRDGGGAHNWGSHQDDMEVGKNGISSFGDSEPTFFEDTEANNTSTELKESKGQGPEAEAETVPVEEEPKELTLDEWKAQRAGRQKPTYNLRKAGEGEDPTQWKKMYELSKKKPGEEEDSDEEEYDTSEFPQRVGRQKRVMGIDFHFSDSRRGGAGRGRGARVGRGGRSVRGGGGGGRGEGGGGAGADNRENKQGQGTPNNRFRAEEQPIEDRGGDTRNAPKVDDERDFPSLG